ncbi:trypsin-like serine protease [Pseudomonas aeruginosa]|uniref:trypsin-like serine protease n=1 Tax=Pseudomonas aeruginosa TaxID=287 RepID=UPI0039827544
MVSSVTGYTDTRNRAWTNEGYDGVVLLTVGNYQGSGALLYGGRAVLTAAHLFEDGVTSAQVTFQTATGTQTLASSKVWIHPAYDAVNTNNDLAIVWLTDQAPAAANRYDLYRSSDEVGQTMTLVGYGLPGTGATGTLTNYGGAPIRQKASNTFDSDVGRLTTVYGNDLSWAPQAGTQLLADFDNGRSTNDALGRLLGLSNTGLGSNEGIITPGDSGGPAFIAGKVAGVASYITSLSTSTTHPDIDSQIKGACRDKGEIHSFGL